ncbi:DNA-binding protein [Streptomyces sp. NPDC048281]|uniref:DNA-binding protein n=1 Tax=Streptomyces sp. NPDC048281 TaxID=3154715 RepID=UPI003438F454
MTAPALSIAEILGHEPALMDLPTFFKACGIAPSTGYQEAAAGRLPLEVIRLGRRRYVRTVSAWKFLGLMPEENGAAPTYQAGASAGNNDEAARVPAGPPQSSKSALTSNEEIRTAP